MFWIREEGQSVTDEKNATRVTTQQVVSDNDIKSTEVSGGRVEHYPVIPHWSVLKWLRHFDCHCCHSVSSQNSPKHRMIMTQRIPVSGNHTMTSRQRKNNKVVPLDPKICERHLELEPLCCSSSCLIRCGCTAIAIFEYIYVLATLTAIILRFHSGGLSQLWPPLKISYNSVATHTILLYIMLAYDLVIVMIATGLLRALLTFDKQIVRMHLCFDYFALAFNVITLVLFLPALFLPNSEDMGHNGVAFMSGILRFGACIG